MIAQNDDLHSDRMLHLFILIHSGYAICCLLFAITLYRIKQASKLYMKMISNTHRLIF